MTQQSEAAFVAALGDALCERDTASRALGICLEEIRLGYARMSMLVRDDMVNGHDIGHGGMTFSLADTAMAFASNSHNQVALAQSASINFIAPARKGDRLTAIAEERSRRGRSGIYDVTVSNQDGETIAVFRGMTTLIKAQILEAQD